MISGEQQIFNQVEKANNILLAFPLDWNGDALGASLAFYLFLKKMGKNVDVVAEKSSNEKNRAFSFLPGFLDIKNSLDNLAKFIISVDITSAKVDQIKYVVNEKTLDFIISPKEGWFTKDAVKSATSGFRYDLIFTFNTPDLESLGMIYDRNVDFFYKTTIVNIDNNPGNEAYGQVNFVEVNAVATAEILFELLKNYKPEMIDEDIATCLLAGIISKTKSFKTPNLTPHALAMTSELIRLGARREEIVNKLYRSRDISSLKLWGKVLSNLKSEASNRLIWSKVFKNDIGDAESANNNLLEVIDELIINIPSAEIITIFYSTVENPLFDGEKEEMGETVANHQKDSQNIFQTEAIIYSTRNLSAIDLCKEYSPTGNRKIAKISSNLPLLSLEKQIIDSLSLKLGKIES
jgi:nanoRNase/pAp phosphatase (c-di-AMP/oligoRNAs hydrolase)